jgi:hypothetical protein
LLLQYQSKLRAKKANIEARAELLKIAVATVRSAAKPFPALSNFGSLSSHDRARWSPIATQTFRSASRAERQKFEGRLGALADARNLFSQEKWHRQSAKDSSPISGLPDRTAPACAPR